MKIQIDYNLSKLNTFGISVSAKFFVEINDENDVEKLFNTSEFKNSEKLFLGGGSNVLFTKDFNGLVILNKLNGIKILSAPTKVGVPTGVGKDFVYIRAMGGEIWHDLVVFAVEHGYWGIENLSYIPGTVGAAPMQNIGAYGAELKDVLVNVEAYNIETGKKEIFSREQCKLGYRDSIFKNEAKGKYFITAITLRLSKIENKNITYKILQDYLEKNKIEIKSSKDISDAVKAIRKSKLPDPALIPNAGSFFKNIFLPARNASGIADAGGEKVTLEDLLEKYPNLPYFEDEGSIKIPAGWLIEQCGWKGKKMGNVGVHEKQALVLVNYGGATGEEVLTLANKIITDVKDKFGLDLTPEVNLI